MPASVRDRIRSGRRTSANDPAASGSDLVRRREAVCRNHPETDPLSSAAIDRSPFAPVLWNLQALFFLSFHPVFLPFRMMGLSWMSMNLRCVEGGSQDSTQGGEGAMRRRKGTRAASHVPLRR